VGDPILASNRTRRVDFALFMAEALTNDELIQQAPAIVSSQSESALCHGLGVRPRRLWFDVRESSQSWFLRRTRRA